MVYALFVLFYIDNGPQQPVLIDKFSSKITCEIAADSVEHTYLTDKNEKEDLRTKGVRFTTAFCLGYTGTETNK